MNVIQNPASTRHRFIRSALLVLLMFGSAGAFAQNAVQALPEADKQEIKNYNLNEDVFNRMVATTKDARAEGIHPQSNPDPSKIHNLNDLTQQALSADPRIEPLIKKHGFTPREFMLANLALMNAAIAAQASNNPEMAKYVDQSRVNPANVAFYKAHESQLAELMQPPEQGAAPQQ